MTSLLDKLNVLVRTSLNTFLTEAPGSDVAGPKIPAQRLGKDIDGEVDGLRKQIDAALTQEDAMRQRLEQLRQAVAALDRQADEALQRHDEATARQLLQQMRRQEQIASMTEAELDQHRRATSEFIERVNVLETVVSDARRQPVGDVPSENAEESVTLADPADMTTSSQVSPVVLSNMLRDARQRVEEALNLPGNDRHDQAPVAEPTTPDKPAARPTEDPAIDEDLARRRARLSKPD